MVVESVEPLIDISTLPLRSVVEGDFFRVTEKLGVEVPVLTLKFLLLSSKDSESGRYNAHYEAGNDVVSEGHGGTLPSDNFSETSGEQDDIKDRLRGVCVE